MSAPKEIELKLVCDTSDFEALKAHPVLAAAGEPSRTTLTSTYFDCEDQRLRRAGLALRVRQRGDGSCVQTVKARGDGLIERPEWETPVAAGAVPDRASLTGTPVAALLRDDAALIEMFKVSFERTSYDVEQGSSRIEIALDFGRVTTPGENGASEPVCEVELELKEGSPQDLFALARAFADVAVLKLGVLAKGERGHLLRDGTPSHATVKAEKVPLDASMSAADAFKAIANGCLRDIRLNEDRMLGRPEADALHQTRVAVRRLRTAISLFGKLFSDGNAKIVGDELKRWTEPLAEARDLDVLLEETLPQERARRPGERGMLNLETQIEARRRRSYEAADARLRSEEWRRGLIDLAGWINAGPWLTPIHPAAVRRLERPASRFAASELSRRLRQLERRSRHLRKLSPEKRHRARISAKKLRYGTEFFGELFDDKKSIARRDKFRRALKKLQNDLGALNDAATAQHLMDAFAKGGAHGRSAIHAAGVTAADIDTEDAATLKSADKARHKLLELRPFWD